MGTSVSSLRDRWKSLHQGSLSALNSRQRGFTHSEPEDRYAASTLLSANNIANVIWLEDVLIYYGSDTQVWDLNLLVRDPSAAAEVLQKNGYAPSSPGIRFVSDPEFSGKGLRLSHQSRETSVVLWSSDDWCFRLESDRQNAMPRLSEFMDAIMEMWLNISLQDYVDRVSFALHIASLLRYCYYLNDPDHGLVKSSEYASNLREEHRELHYDIVDDDPQNNFAYTARHRYHVRCYNEIKRGEYKPQPRGKGEFQPALPMLSEEG